MAARRRRAAEAEIRHWQGRGIRACGHIAIYRSPAYVFIIAMPLRRWIPAQAGIQRRNFLLL